MPSGDKLGGPQAGWGGRGASRGAWVGKGGETGSEYGRRKGQTGEEEEEKRSYDCMKACHLLA